MHQLLKNVRKAYVPQLSLKETNPVSFICFFSIIALWMPGATIIPQVPHRREARYRGNTVRRYSVDPTQNAGKRMAQRESQCWQYWSAKWGRWYSIPTIPIYCMSLCGKRYSKWTAPICRIVCRNSSLQKSWSAELLYACKATTIRSQPVSWWCAG